MTGLIAPKWSVNIWHTPSSIVHPIQLWEVARHVSLGYRGVLQRALA